MSHLLQKRKAMIHSVYILIPATILVLSCGDSKEELRMQIAERDAIVVRQRQEISDLEDKVQELEDKIYQINEYASNAQDAIDNARYSSYRYEDLDDAEDEINNIYDESY